MQQKKNLFNRLAEGDVARDAILQEALDAATQEQLDLATYAMEQGHTDEIIFIMLGDN